MKSHSEILMDLNDSVTGCYTRRRRVLDDISFAKIPSAQWAGSYGQQFKNKPKPENNRIATQVNRVLGEYFKLDINAVIVPASEDADEQNAQLLENLWRNDFNMAGGEEALNNAADEAFFGGFGAVQIKTRFEDDENPDYDKQCLEIAPIYSAASAVFFSAGSIKKDKSDSTQGWLLERANRKLLNRQYQRNVATVGEQVDFFDWDFDTNKDVYIAHYYEISQQRQTIYDFGFTRLTKKKRKYYTDENQPVDPDEAKALIDTYAHDVMTKNVNVVEYALVDGLGFLEKPRLTAHTFIPLIPQYGYHFVINGIEYYLGEVARQRDNQRFMNMAYSAMMQILAENQTTKPEFTPQQVQKYKQMWATQNVEDYPYLLSDPIMNPDGTIAHLGEVGRHEPPQIGSGLASVLQFLNENIADQGAEGQVDLPANVATETIQQINERIDDSRQMLFQNAFQTIRQACKTWMNAAQELYFSNPRTLRIQNKDQSFSTIQTMQMGYDPQSGMVSQTKNSGVGRYDVVIKTNESLKSVQEARRGEALEALQYTDTATPIGQLLLLEVVKNSKVSGDKNIKRLTITMQFKLMLDNGVMPQPEDETESQVLAQLIRQMQQQGQQQDPEVMIEQAQLGIEQRNAETRFYEAQTKRMQAHDQAHKQDYEIEKIQAETEAIKHPPKPDKSKLH